MSRTTDRHETAPILPSQIVVYPDGSVACVYGPHDQDVTYRTDDSAAAAHEVSAHEWYAIPRTAPHATGTDDEDISQAIANKIWRIAAAFIADKWVDSLGYSPDGEWSHPIISAKDLRYMDDDQAREQIRGMCSDTRDKLIKYAREAIDVADEIEESLKEAGYAARNRDLEGAKENLEIASRLEMRYGDNPTVRPLLDLFAVE